ncbi:MAG: DUF1697 domain-containing protein [Anaerolineae bacterium]|nr:DUF1697 domain-containing protein [Anaerolineae bacterium]
MTTYIALLRGINVGGNNRLPMKALVDILNALGAEKVKTYVQSGNVVLQCTPETAADLAQRLGDEIRARHGFEPHILTLSQAELEKAMANNPFPEAEANPSSLHLGFLADTPSDPKLDKLESLRAESERFRLIDNVFYLHAPEGIGRSKLAANSERLLGAAMTDRNWNTVCKLKEMASE